MRIILNLKMEIPSTEGYIEHNGEKITFNACMISKKSFLDNYGEMDLFKELNKYWSMLPEVDQKAIFDIYSDIHDSYSNVHIGSNLEEYISERIVDLYHFHKYEHLHSWAMMDGCIIVPSNVPFEYVKNIDNNTSTDKTYVRKEYFDLMVLALLFRVFIPIWGDYISNTRKQKGNQFKEYHAFKLLNKTEIMSLEPVHKLLKYIEAIATDKVRPDTVLKNIPSGEINLWLFSIIAVRKLTTIDIRGVLESEGNVSYNNISYIFKTIKDKLESTDNNFENSYKEKKVPAGHGEEDKVSFLESYKAKANISTGDIVELEHAICDIEHIMTELAYGFSISDLTTSFDTIVELRNKQIVEPQVILLGWVFKSIISPKGFYYISKDNLINSIAMLETILWTRGHKYLALLSSSYVELTDSDLIISPVDSKMRVDAELEEELIKYYPMCRTIYSRKRKGGVVNKVNLALESINSLTDMFSMYSWKLTADSKKVEQVFGSKTTRCPILPDIKNQLTKLCIDLGSNF